MLSDCRLRDHLFSSGLKEGYDDNGGKHQADHGGINDADNLDSLAVFIIVEAQSLEHSREAVAHMEPNDDKEYKVSDGNVRDLELFTCLLVEVKVAVNPTEFDKEEIGEMQQEASDDEDARPHLQFRASVRLGALRFFVTFGSSHLVGDGQPDGQDDVEQQGTKQYNLKGFHNIVGAHKITKGVVPRAAVVTQDAEVG